MQAYGSDEVLEPTAIHAAVAAATDTMADLYAKCAARRVVAAPGAVPPNMCVMVIMVNKGSVSGWCPPADIIIEPDDHGDEVPEEPHVRLSSSSSARRNPHTRGVIAGGGRGGDPLQQHLAGAVGGPLLRDDPLEAPAAADAAARAGGRVAGRPIVLVPQQQPPLAKTGS